MTKSSEEIFNNKFSGEEIQGCLANANSLAIDKSVPLENNYPAIVKKIDFLSDEKRCKAKTYLAVFTVGVIGRALRSSQDLDVLATNKSLPKGYSAQQISVALASFAKYQNINLRTRSTNPINNQPFFHNARILPTIEEMKGRLGLGDAYTGFYEALLEIQTLESSQAQEVLALIFRMSRVQYHGVERSSLTGGRENWTQLITSVDEFVKKYVDNGRVGQAFVAAALSVVWPHQEVTTKLINDPSFSSPGDVVVSSKGKLWLAAEVKQKPQSIEDVAGFAKDAKGRGVDRVYFAALHNVLNNNEIDREKIRKIEQDLNLALTLFESSEELLRFVSTAGPESHDLLGSELIYQMKLRLEELACEVYVLEAFEEEVVRSLNQN